ncbi:uncharacterized protein BJ171DRAFT_507096 [Polychytrium aggregatum]|uniref:uncharacterized protein n=1 Tax=Polychytrium aggregatum TaxID=110093 RepID=UPI0022FE23A5|nr:uncharacterized protein BJ171DRAFT_507096 [Polychytrium aggregatum]KAI9203942.1 hypothetical protein BJ171DRAFT_507096 [Polychytrium aggregatum]
MAPVHRLPKISTAPNPTPAVVQQSGMPGSDDTPLMQFAMSFFVILVSEIGDKTFFIAAVLAMRNSRLLIFSGAMGALVFMTILSAFLGHILPNLISKQYTQLAAGLLFIVFGLKMLKDVYTMSGTEGKEELEEVTQELAEAEVSKKTDELEGGGLQPQPKDEWWVPFQNLATYLFSPILIQTFVMTFLAEWGDRSQIATIALAGAQGFWFVTLGGLVGHGICTAVAVVGGRLLAERISVRVVTLLGAILFLLFGFASIYQAAGPLSADD